MRARRLPRGTLAFGLPIALLVAAAGFYVARGGDLSGDSDTLVGQLGRDLNPCHDPSGCLHPSAELSARFDDAEACRPDDSITARVCLVLLGDVPVDLAASLVDYYEREYALIVDVPRPVTIPEEFILAHRPQYSGDWLFDAAAESYPQEVANPAVTFIVLTPVDVWLEEQTNWRWAFGELKGNEYGGYKNAIVSHYRMDDRTWGWYFDQALFESRVRKMLNKYVAVAFYGLPFSSDPRSATYNHIRSVGDLDAMSGRIPVP